MSIETRRGNGTLAQLEQFGMKLELPIAIEGIMNLAGLENLIKDTQQFIGESPLLSQAYLEMKYYMKLLHGDSQDQQASVLLTKAFGIVKPGIDEDGKVSSQITREIIKVRTSLVDRVQATTEKTRKDLAISAAFLRTIQEQILELLINQSEALDIDFEEEKIAEEAVTTHLANTNTQDHIVVFEANKASSQAQDSRTRKSKISKNKVSTYFENLFEIAKEAFRPAEKGTQEVGKMLQMT